jgi:hypothetical protein
MTLKVRLLPGFIALSAWLLTTVPAHADLMGVQMFVDGVLVGTETAEPDPNAAVPISFDAVEASFQMYGLALLDVDPFIDYNFSVVNFTENALLFEFLFLSPFTMGPYDTLLSEFSSTVTDSDQSGAAAVLPDDASGLMAVPQIDSVDVLGAALGDGCTPVMAPGATVDCDPFSSTSASVVTLADGFFAVAVSFFLSGGDAMSGQGRVELTNTIPEPASLALFGLGIGILAVRRRRATAPGR